MQSQPFMQSGATRFLLLFTMVMVVFALGAYTRLTLSQVDENPYGPSTISVSGSGEVVAIPDVGNFTFTVEAEGDTAEAAQETSATAMNDILAFLAEQGVEEKDVKTTNYNLMPKYRYEERVCANNSYCPPGERVQDGFSVYQSVSVKVRDTKETGPLLTGVGERGATNISGITFTVDDDEALKTEARAKAIADAKAKAEVLAADLGVKLVRVMSYYEESGYPKAYGYGGAMDMAVEESAMRVTPDIPTGENTTTSNVTLVFEIR